jgi:hypothetical protein
MRQTAITRNVTVAYRWEGRVWVAAPYGAGWRYRSWINRAPTRGRK